VGPIPLPPSADWNKLTFFSDGMPSFPVLTISFLFDPVPNFLFFFSPLVDSRQSRLLLFYGDFPLPSSAAPPSDRGGIFFFPRSRDLRYTDFTVLLTKLSNALPSILANDLFFTTSGKTHPSLKISISSLLLLPPLRYRPFPSILLFLFFRFRPF